MVATHREPQCHAIQVHCLEGIGERKCKKEFSLLAAKNRQEALETDELPGAIDIFCAAGEIIAV